MDRCDTFDIFFLTSENQPQTRNPTPNRPCECALSNFLKQVPLLISQTLIFPSFDPELSNSESEEKSKQRMASSCIMNRSYHWHVWHSPNLIQMAPRKIKKIKKTQPKYLRLIIQIFFQFPAHVIPNFNKTIWRSTHKILSIRWEFNSLWHWCFPELVGFFFREKNRIMKSQISFF